MTALRKAASPRTLGQILAGLVRVSAKEDRPVFGLSLDSRQTQKGDLFLACAGSEHHGIAFAQNAIDQGCAAVAYEPTPNMQPLPRLNVPLVAVPALGSQLGLIGDRFYRSPSSRAAVVGVTGTNGKTSIAHYLGQSLHAHAGRCGFIGTLGSGFYGALAPVVNTTPDAISIQRELAQMTDAGARYAVM
jgi:UDP-N-acetylmuramoyl-L-alanyl-D-glutamate--2,6-diaminopimelate ligase